MFLIPHIYHAFQDPYALQFRNAFKLLPDSHGFLRASQGSKDSREFQRLQGSQVSQGSQTFQDFWKSQDI